MSATSQASSLSYTLIDGRDAARREIDCPLSSWQLDQLDREGHLALPGVLEPARQAALLAAVDRLRTRIDGGELAAEYGPGEEFYRDLPSHDETFVELMLDPLLLGSARAMLGPLVRLRGMTCRDNRPATGGNPGFGWHIHQRVACDPLPRWWSPPQGLDCLLYLDGLDASSGAVAVLPGSHRQPTRSVAWDQADHPDQVVLELPPGSVLLMHPNVYHRSLPARSAAARRRLLIVSWTPSWYRQCPYDRRDRTAWVELMRARWQDDPSKLELLGIGGYS
jgi:hypothetical protein